MVLGRIEAKNQPSYPLVGQIQDRVVRGLEYLGSLTESLFNPEIAHTILIPSQENILKNLRQVVNKEVIVNEQSLAIIEGLAGHPLNHRALTRLLGGQMSSFKRPVKGADVEVRIRDGVDIARLPTLSPFPEHLPKVVAVTSWDLLLSDIYDKRSFQTVSIGDKTLPLYDNQGKAYPPDDLFRDPLAKLKAGDSMRFSNGNGLTMQVTILPIWQDNPMPRFVLAVDEHKAKNFPKTIAEARRRNLAILWLVKETHFGLIKALFWQDLDDPTKRIFLQDGRGNKVTFDNMPVGRERFARDILEGRLDIVIEHHEGNLEERQQEYKLGIQDRDSSPRFYRILIAAVADISETGGSLVRYGLGEVLEVFQCPPVAVTFDYTP